LEKSDLNRIKGLRSGRERAYEQLFADYYKPLSLFALRYVIDLETAKEIVQDLFVALYENRKSLLITNSLKSYLYQSVRNRCLNHLKHIQVDRRHMENLKLNQELSEDLEANIEKGELEARIFQIVSDLPPRCQDIFKKSRVKGMKNKEIAEHLDISIRTVETQISNALKILRTKLGSDENL
jgi:RNA polymerase sigma-70 factor (ECF subfamily)